jgi:hypothetical protein
MVSLSGIQCVTDCGEPGVGSYSASVLVSQLLAPSF